jgi:hypothetical protein
VAQTATILTGGIGLGIYIPALLIRDQLLAQGVAAEIVVLEELYTPEARLQQHALERACRADFALAQMSHRMTRGVESSLDPQLVDTLVETWMREERRHFMVWSGFWLPIVDRYKRRACAPLRVDHCRIDAEISGSFRAHEPLDRDANDVWLWSWSEKRTVFEIPVDDRQAMRWDERDDRLVVHGGGWGLGTHRRALDTLQTTRWACDAIVHDIAATSRSGDRNFAVDSAWRPEQRCDGNHMFPPFGEVGHARTVEKHAMYDLVRGAKAIVSKPGGGTLIDSLSSATPLVILEPYGEAEAKNGALWQYLGYGISFEEWRDHGYDDGVLRTLHDNLRGRRRGASYARLYAEHFT